MEVGKFCPAYTSFAHLYPSSVELQSALCRYYASVIRLCTKIIAILQRSPVVHAFSSVISPFESEFSEDIAQLRADAEMVKLQCTHAAYSAAVQAEELAAEERRMNHRFRLKITKEQDEARASRLQQSQHKISQLREAPRDRLSTLSSLNAYRRVLQQRVPKTAEWFQNDDVFRQWRDDRHGAVLWCPGKMGAGKTVLMSSIVEHLHISRRSTDAISHHFCFSDHDASLEARNIVGSIAKQMLEDWLHKASADELRALHRSVSSDVNSADMTDIVSHRLLSSTSYYILLDGIDECEPNEAREVVAFLSKLSQKHRAIKVVLTSRPDIDRVLRQGLSIQYKMSVFLWVRLFINDLCAQKSDNDILAALQGPPPSISLLIDKTIDRIQQCASSKDVLKLLQFCGILKRSLTVEEFRELLSFTTNQRARDIGQMIHDVGEIVAETGGLVYIDEEEQTVHYVHQSVKNHLFGRSPHRDGFCTTELDLHLGFLILIYLNFNDFKRSLVKVDSGSTTSFRPVDIAVSSVSGSNSQVLRTAARKLLRNRQNLQSLKGKDLERKIRDTVGTGDLSTNQLESQYPFLEYAKSYWLDHLEEIEPESDARIWRLFDTLVKGENGLISTPWNAGRVVSRVAYEKTKQTLEWALSNQKPALVMYELVHNIDTVRESDQQQILSIASGKALFRLMSVLIRKQTPSRGVIYKAFTKAAHLGLTDCVDLYIQKAFDPNDRPDEEYNTTPLQAAAEGGHLEVVDRLLTAKANANVNAAPSEEYGRTALQAAAEGGHLEVVDRLLTAKANAAPAGSGGRTALQAAARGGHLEVVDRLLTAKAHVNAAAALCGGRTSLQAAAEGGHLEVVDRLLTAKANVDALDPGSGGRTALQFAAAEGHLQIVKRIEDAGGRG
ncbi:hypothetical protein LTS17_012539 [Exophiala oligosperma]